MKKGALFTVFLVVLIDLIGFGIVLPLLPFFGDSFHASPATIGLLFSVYSIMQLIFSPIWGSLSDKIGRRPIMLLSTLGASVAYVIFGFANSLLILFTSRMVAGMMGGNISTAQAYVADVTTDEERTKGMGLLGAAFGIGFVLGPALATLLIHPSLQGQFSHLGLAPYALPGFFAAFLSLCSFFLVLIKLPETVRQQAQTTQGDGRVEKISIFQKEFWQSIATQAKEKGKEFLPLLLLCSFLLSLGQSSLYSSFPLFCEAYLALTPREVGSLYIYSGLIAIFVQGGLIHQLVKRFQEEELFFTGSILLVIGLVLLPFSMNKLTLMLYLGILSFGASLTGPTLNSLLSKKADPEKIGLMMGTAQGMSGLGRAIGPTWSGILYGFLFYLPFVATALLVSITIRVGLKLRKS